MSSKVVCPDCGVVFNKEADYIQHRKKQKVPCSLECVYCENKFKSEYLCTKHFRLISNTKTC